MSERPVAYAAAFTAAVRDMWQSHIDNLELYGVDPAILRGILFGEEPQTVPRNGRVVLFDEDLYMEVKNTEEELEVGQ